MDAAASKRGEAAAGGAGPFAQVGSTVPEDREGSPPPPSSGTSNDNKPHSRSSVANDRSALRKAEGLMGEATTTMMMKVPPASSQKDRKGTVQTWTWNDQNALVSNSQKQERPTLVQGRRGVPLPSSRPELTDGDRLVRNRPGNTSGSKSAAGLPSAAGSGSMILEESYELDGAGQTIVHEPLRLPHAKESVVSLPIAWIPRPMILEESYEVDGVLQTIIHEPFHPPPPEIASRKRRRARGADRRSATAQRATRGQQAKPDNSKWNEFNAAIKVGPDHQARIPPLGSHSPGEESPRGTVLWDPDRVSRGLTKRQVHDVRLLMTQEREFSDQMVLMECLAETDYVASDAQALFDARAASRRSFHLTGKEHDVFERMVHVKDFSAIAKALRRSKEEVITYYYHWKGVDRNAYDAAMSSRKKRQNECCVCDDGGFLVVCERCRRAFHLGCVEPPLIEVPTGDWYCCDCIVPSPSIDRRPSLKGARLSSSPKRKSRQALESPRKRLLSTQLEFTARSKSRNVAVGTRTCLDASFDSLRSSSHSDPEEDITNAGAGSTKGLSSSRAPSPNTENSNENEARVGTAASGAELLDDPDDNNSSSSSVCSSPVAPAKSNKTFREKIVRNSDSDESYIESEGEGSAASGVGNDDDNVFTMGTLTKEDHAIAMTFGSSIVATDERVSQRSAERGCQYEVLVPFKSNGSLGVSVAMDRASERFVVTGYYPETSKSHVHFMADRDVILKVDDEDTRNMTWAAFLSLCRQPSENKLFKKLLMLNQGRHPGSSPSIRPSEHETGICVSTTTPRGEGEAKDGAVLPSSSQNMSNGECNPSAIPSNQLGEEASLVVAAAAVANPPLSFAANVIHPNASMESMRTTLNLLHPHNAG